jgi:hypothetical protein
VDSNSVLIGFTIRNGFAENGGGIYCYCPASDGNGLFLDLS